MMSPIRNVVFDAGGVLVHWNPDAVIRKALGPDVDADAARAAVYGHPDWHLYDQGRINSQELARRVAERLPLANGAFARLIQTTLECLTPIEGSLRMMEDLRRRGKRLYMLSNMPAETFDYLQGAPYWSLLDGWVISAHVGLLKPGREIYEHLLEKHGLVAEETVFFDDLEANIRGARELGIHGILFQDPDQARADLEKLMIETE